MKKMLPLVLGAIVLVVLVVVISVNFFSSSLGSVLSAGGRGKELYYEGGVTESQAKKLVAELTKFEFFAGKKAVKVQTVKTSEGYVVRLPVPQELREDKDYAGYLCALGEHISQTVFGGSPVVMENCTEELETKKKLESFPDLLKRDPELAYLSRATVLYNLGEMEKQIRGLEEAVEVLPESALLLNELAYELASTGRYQKGLEYSERSLQLAPNDPSYLDTKGYILAGLGRYEEATGVYRAALKVSTKENAVFIHLGLARVYEQTGNVASAQQHQELAAKIDPNLRLNWEPDQGI